jgi:uncharacterized protein with FMN-binding domain
MNIIPKRGVIGGLLTVVALVLILSFKTPDPTGLLTTAGAASSPGVYNNTTGQSTTQGQQGAAASQSAAATQGTGTTTSRSSYSGQITGQAIQIPFGTVQVQVTFTNGKITDVQALQMPSFDRHSQEISSYAAPQLRSEVLAAQSAQINSISGATYTSYGYAQSLQSALDQLGA